MGGAVFTVAHGIVGEYEESGQLHQGGKPDGGSRIIGEDKKSCAKGTQLGKRHPVDNRAHGMLSNPVVQISAARIAGLEVAGPVESQRGFVRGRKISGTADEPGDILSEYV